MSGHPAAGVHEGEPASRRLRAVRVVAAARGARASAGAAARRLPPDAVAAAPEPPDSSPRLVSPGAVTKSGELLLSCDETRSQARRLLHAKHRSRRDLLFVTRGHRRRATWRSASSGCRRRWTRRAPHAPEVHHLSSPVHDAPESRQPPTTRPSGERRAAGVCRPALVAGDGGEAARAGPGEAAARPKEGEPREQEGDVRVGKESDAFWLSVHTWTSLRNIGRSLDCRS